MNPLTWQNPEQLFVAQVLKKIFYNSVAELRCFWLQATCSGVILGKLECEIGIALQYENIFKFSLKRTFKRIRNNS